MFFQLEEREGLAAGDVAGRLASIFGYVGSLDFYETAGRFFGKVLTLAQRNVNMTMSIRVGNEN